MALIVEDGTGLVDADSYLSVADADAYHATYGAPVAWSGSTTAQKEEALRIATRYLDATYGVRWRGRRLRDVQALDWPRIGAEDNDGYSIDAASVPAALGAATAVAALKHRDGTDLLPDLVSNTSVTGERVKIGPIEISNTYAGGQVETAQVRFSLVERLLRSLTWPAGWMVRG